MTEKAPSSETAPYDALLLCSFGGPNGTDDVIPFLRNVTRGKNIPEERLAEVGEHYHHFDGRSPINEQNLALVDALRGELEARGTDLPVFGANPKWNPTRVDPVREARAFGGRGFLPL
jgi:ferrochelatase